MLTYGGYCVRLDAVYDTIVTPLSIDVSTGDVITPDAVKYEFSGIFDENIGIRLWGYIIETIIAEKDCTLKSLVVGIFVLLRFLLLLGRNNLQKYAIICQVTEFLKKNAIALKGEKPKYRAKCQMFSVKYQS